MENWLEKYRPTKLSDMLGDKRQINQIDKFIKLFIKKKSNSNSNSIEDNIPNPNLIISGTNGIGKSLVVDLVLKENNFEKVTADLSNVSIQRKNKKKAKNETPGTNRSIRSYYIFLQNSRILTLEEKYKETKFALVFDNVSNISNKKEKEAIKAIVKLNNKLKKFPIILITNTKHSKTVNELRKSLTFSLKLTSGSATEKKKTQKITNEIQMKSPSFDELELFIKNICKKELIKLASGTEDDDLIVQIFEHAQFDVRRLINTLEELKMMYSTTKITSDIFTQYKISSKKKDLDPGIYEATKMLLNNYTDMDTALAIYSEDRSTIPLIVHENYPINIQAQYPKMQPKNQIELIHNISRSISESDKLDGLIYSNQCWNLQSVHGFYSCVMPSYYINKPPGKQSNKEIYNYTQDYNKSSIKKNK